MEIVIPQGPGMRAPSPSTPPPSPPKRFGQNYYTSAPTSLSHFSDQFYQEFDNLYMMNDTFSSSAKSPKEDEFSFILCSELEQASLTAEELFDGGTIRPLKPTPRLQAAQKSPLLSPTPRSPKSPNPFSQGKKIISDVFSPRDKKKAIPFADNTQNKTQHERGRRNDLSNGSCRVTRSLSPYRDIVSESPCEEEEEEEKQLQHQRQQLPIKQSSLNSKPSKKWRFTDFLLFRSASEGRAAEKDPLRKYSGFRRNEDARNTEGSGSGRRIKKGLVSPHELHYTKNKAASQELKKKTFLPYKSAILGFHGLGVFTRT